MTTPITNDAIRAAARAKVASTLPKGSTFILTAIGRRDDSRIALQGLMRYLDVEGDHHNVYVTATLDGMLVEQVIWANFEAQADIDFMQVAL